MRRTLVLALFVSSIVLITACKKEEEKKAPSTGNISQAPANIDQSFDIEVVVEQDKVVEVVFRTGVTEFSKTTYKYEIDTLTETRFEHNRLASMKKHRLEGELISFTADTVYQGDSIAYFNQIFYTYSGSEMMLKKIDQYDNSSATVPVNSTEYMLMYIGGNLNSVEYISADVSDTLPCTDRYEASPYTATFDMHNLLGIAEGSRSLNLKNQSNHLINCGGNGSVGSTSYKYWYNINGDGYITRIVYSKDFKGTTQVFEENYNYKFR